MKQKFVEANTIPEKMVEVRNELTKFLDWMWSDNIEVFDTMLDHELGVFCDENAQLVKLKTQNGIMSWTMFNTVVIDTTIHSMEWINDKFGPLTNLNNVRVRQWLFVTDTSQIRKFCWTVDAQVLHFNIEEYKFPQGKVTFQSLDGYSEGFSEVGSVAHEMYKGEDWFCDGSDHWIWLDVEPGPDVLNKMTIAVNAYLDKYNRFFTVKDPQWIGAPGDGDRDIIWTIVPR